MLEDSDYRELYRVEDVSPGGSARFGISGKITRVRVDISESFDRFGRRGTIAHAVLAPAGRRPRSRVDDALTGALLSLAGDGPAAAGGARGSS